jgi:ABC-type sugar transport system permease subunit
MGYAAAIAFVLFIVILLATLVQFRLQKERA